MNFDNENFTEIVIVDTIMGGGKTSWAIQDINNHSNENVMYITPFLKEVDRVITSTNREFREPINKGDGKLCALNQLLQCGEDIASTHVLFANMDDTSKSAIADNHYVLYLDEVLNVVQPFNLRKNDLNILKDSNCITIDDDGYVYWNPEKKSYDSKYNEFKLLCENHSMICVNGKLLLWKYPPDVFRLFKKIYILTYDFQSSILRYYFDLHKVPYKKYSVILENNKYKLSDYKYDKTGIYGSLINIYEGNLNTNMFSKKPKIQVFSSTWFQSPTNKAKIEQLKNNLFNYFININKAKSNTIMWTCFKFQKSKLSGKGYTKGFLSCNSRSTNEHSDKFNLAYCLNLYLHPTVDQFFLKHKICIDQDRYALNEMIQWIWRSRIRKGEPINIYIPSERMRLILCDWINGRYRIINNNK